LLPAAAPTVIAPEVKLYFPAVPGAKAVYSFLPPTSSTDVPGTDPPNEPPSVVAAANNE
jgi:hypothetical protein